MGAGISLVVLVNVRSRLRILMIAGTFVVVSGLAYFAFMAAWLNIFMFLGMIRPLQIVLGVVALFIGGLNVKDFFAFHRGGDERRGPLRVRTELSASGRFHVQGQ